MRKKTRAIPHIYFPKIRRQIINYPDVNYIFYNYLSKIIVKYVYLVMGIKFNKFNLVRGGRISHFAADES